MWPQHKVVNLNSFNGCVKRILIVFVILFFQVVILSLFENCGITVVFAFNIDDTQPIVIKNVFHDPTAHFGISVALLERQRPNELQNPQEPTGWIMVGCPKGNSTHRNHSKIFEPGVIWRCALGRSPQPHQDDCKIMQIDPTGEYDPKNPNWAHQDKKDGSWIGGSMFVGTDRFVTCGSRWVNKKYTGNYLMNGICYWVPSMNVVSDKINDTWPWLPPKFSYRLNALIKKNRQTFSIPLKDVPENKWEKRFDWAYGQMGFSISIPKNNEMIIGAPGVFEWTGTVMQFRDSKEPDLHKRFNVHPSSSAFSEILIARIRRADEPSKILGESDYFGYAVTSGNYFYPKISQNRTQYVAGAPRSASLAGKVLVFSFNETVEEQTAALDYLIEPIEINQIHTGFYGSYFGSVLASVDVNSDGFHDLLVGAPQYGAPQYGTSYSNQLHIFKQHENSSESNDNNEFPTMTSGDEGCVFIYISTGYKFMEPQIICGDKISGARFGSAISSLGDLNGDQYNDIAVGAPYENEEGAVYIYHGGETITFAQKLVPNKIDSSIRGFGYSLYGSIDIDGNLYPDLAVGAYQSNHVIIFRTLPLANFSATLTSTIPKLLTTTHEFNITSCISFHGRSLPEVLYIRVQLSIIQELSGKKVLTWVLHENQVPQNVSNLIQPLLTLSKLLYFKRGGTCYNFTILRIGELDGITKEVHIKKNYWIDGYDKPMEIQPTIYEIHKDSDGLPKLKHNESQPKFQDFYKKMPISIDNMFGSTVLNLSIGTICEADGDPICTADLKIKAAFRDKHGNLLEDGQSFVVGTSDVLTLEVELWNYKEIANLPITLDIKWISPPVIRKASAGDCEKLKNGTNYKCYIKRPIKENRVEIIHMEFDMTGLYAGEVGNIIPIHIKADTSSELMKKAKIIFQLPIQLQMEVLNYTYEHETSVGNILMPAGFLNFSQAYEVGLTGPTPIHSARLEIHVPKFLEINGQSHEFIFIRRPLVTYDGNSSCKAVNGSFLDEEIGNLSYVNQYRNNGIFQPTKLSTEDPFVNEESNKENQFILHNSGFDDNYVDVRNPTANEILLGKVRRMKRSTVETFYNIFNLGDTLEGEHGVLKLSCKDSKITCMKVICDVEHFHDWSKSVIEFKLRLKNSITQMLLKQHDDIEFIWFESGGILKMIDKEKRAFGNFADVRVITKLKIPNPVDIPAWILIVSIAGGILLLTLIIILLIKCGFFRRENKEKLELLMANERDEQMFK